MFSPRENHQRKKLEEEILEQAEVEHTEKKKESDAEFAGLENGEGEDE